MRRSCASASVPLPCEQADAAGRVEHVAAGRVVDRVAGLRLARHLVVEDLEVLGDGARLLGRAAQRHEALVEVLDVGLQQLGRVALGVDGHEHHLHALAVGAQLLLHGGQLHQRGGADIGAVREAEEHHHHLALELGERPALAGGIAEFQALRVVGTGDVDGLERRLRRRAQAGQRRLVAGRQQWPQRQRKDQGAPNSHGSR